MGLAKRVAIVGVGITKHGFFPRKSWKDLVADAYFEALDDTKMDPGEIETGFISITIPEILEQENMGPLISDFLGIVPAGFPQINNACAGGASGLRMAVFAIASGMYRRVLVTGVEKISDCCSTGESMMNCVDWEYEGVYGYDFIDFMALMQNRYMSKYKVGPEGIAQFAVQDRWYANRNPKAIDASRPPLTVEGVLESPYISEPVTALSCARACDGASAVLVVPAEDAKRFTNTPVFVDGISLRSGPQYLASKIHYPGYEGFDISESFSTMEAAREAYKMAGIEPKDVSLAQVHDCFTINGIVQLEGLGIFPFGKGADAVLAGGTAIDGKCPTNTDGGRIGLGHPTGATGLNMVVESVIQLRGAAGERQIPNADIAVCDTMGGTNASLGVTVLRRR